MFKTDIPNEPVKKDNHIINLWSDYIEMRAFMRGAIDVYEIVEQIGVDIQNIVQTEDHEPGIETAEDLLENIEDEEGLDEIFSLPEEDQVEIPGIDEDDFLRDQVKIFFQYLIYRSSHINSYPFLLDPEELVISIKPELTSSEKIYLYLLITANQEFLDDKSVKSNTLRYIFENTSLHAFKNFLMDNFCTYHVGTSKFVTQEDSPFDGIGTMPEILEVLKKELKTDLLTSSEKLLSHKNRGENGLDLISWSKDLHPRKVFLGQCATTKKDWYKKIDDVSTDKWENIILFKVKPSMVLFVPHDAHHYSGWYDDQIHMKGLIFDRRSLLTYIEKIEDDLLENNFNFELYVVNNRSLPSGL